MGRGIFKRLTDETLNWMTPYELRAHEHVYVTPGKMSTEMHDIRLGSAKKARPKDVSAATRKKGSYGY